MVTGGRDRDLFGGNRAAVRLDPDDTAALGADRRDLAILDDIDAARIGRPRIAPGYRVVPRDAAAPLQRRAEHRVTRVGRDVEDRAEALDGTRVEPFGVDAVEPVGVYPPRCLADVGLVMRQVQDAALAQHEVEIEFGRKPLPQLQRMLVDPRTGVPEIIRADDRRVAPGIAETDRAFFEHRDIADAMLFRKIISGRQPVPAAADNHDIVALSRRRLAPGRGPAPVSR